VIEAIRRVIGTIRASLRMGRHHVVLRQTSDGLGSRHLSARLKRSGDLVIQGKDTGQGVEDVFGEGFREYEWAWTIGAGDVPKLAEALGAREDVLGGLEARFSGDRSAELGEFLESCGIPVERWSRMGD
jgi:hypothetical protein